jgi:hypothetical protein
VAQVVAVSDRVGKDQVKLKLLLVRLDTFAVQVRVALQLFDCERSKKF